MFHDTDIFRQLSLAERLARVSRLWKMAADRELAPLGLTHPRWTALWKLQRLGDHISQKQLACALEIELPSLMRTLNQLEEQLLITRHPCEHDKRSRIVCLTPEGQQLLTKMETKIMRVRNQILAEISNEEVETLSLLLEKIADNALSTLSD
ncbi:MULTISPECIES: transcriptional regulator SlyA [Vibrio]|uniref:Transcriptional regulator SlyA n=2 Tax=Vibrio TaxID=662 RepID=A0A7X4RUD4_9VIBR|nr:MULTISPECIES: transcriptional regulator SlyA [Vibrio]MBF9003377.1 transcriptional regulator SlyA [Vibrio nitrifigilis]MZI93142.1 transcriptional regulator SlyA [Vibrio eleionomae]